MGRGLDVDFRNIKLESQFFQIEKKDIVENGKYTKENKFISTDDLAKSRNKHLNLPDFLHDDILIV